MIGVDALIQLLRSLPPGVIELGCHPGVGDDVDSVYSGERAIEVETLCHPRVRAAISDEAIELISFHDVSSRNIDRSQWPRSIN
jgi:predicted glycoside hydrolase/deacetylase ChbG (UPF0249 family)